MKIKLSLTLSTSHSDNRLKGVDITMGDWVKRKRQQQVADGASRQQNQEMLEGLGATCFLELSYEVQSDVAEINKEYPQLFNKNTNDQLVFMGGMSDRFEVKQGPNTLLTVEYDNRPPSLKAQRRLRRGSTGGAKYASENYFFKHDKQSSLRIEDKDGNTIPRDDMSQRLLDFLTDD